MRKLLLAITLGVIFIFANAQDVQYSQLIWNEVYLNPALAGNHTTDNRLFGIYRDQWRQANVPFVSTNFTYDRKLKLKSSHIIGLGGSFFYDRAGSASLSNTQVDLVAAYTYLFSTKQKLSIGFSGGYGLRSLDGSKLIFDETPSGNETLLSDRFSMFRFSTGIHFFTQLKQAGTFETGLTIVNPHQPNGTFFNVNTDQKTRFTAYQRMSFDVSDKWKIQPSFIFSYQAGVNQELINVLARYQMDEWGLWFGPGYRWGDAIVGQVGVEYANARLGFSYDQNISDYKEATNGIGAFEVSLIYGWNKKSKPTPVSIPAPIVIEELEDSIEQVEEVQVPEPLVLSTAMEEKPLPFEPEKVFDLKAGQKVVLYFDNNSPKENEQKDYQAIHQEYYQKKELYKEKGGEPAAAFFEEELKSEFEIFEDIAEYIYYCLQLKKKVRISFKGYSSKLGSSQYNEQLSKRRIHSIKEYLLQYKGGVLKDFIQNQQLELVEVPLGYNNSNLSGTEDKIKAIYSSEAAKDRKVELTIEEIK